MAEKRPYMNEADIVRKIDDILEAIRSPENADEIIELKKIFKQHVPLFDRSYFAVFLLKEALRRGDRFDRGRGRGNDRSGRDARSARDDRAARDDRNAREDKPARQDRPAKGEGRNEQRPPKNEGKARQAEARGEQKGDEPRPPLKNLPLPEGVEAATLFVSAGRKRHFYPRHFLDLVDGAGISRDAIGEIRLFDNYTFVQVRAETAASIVEKLDGTAFKGRRLTVNPARKKEEGGERPERPAEQAEGSGESDWDRPAGLGQDREALEDVDRLHDEGRTEGSADDSLGRGDLEDEDLGDENLDDGDLGEDMGRPAGLGTGGYGADYVSEEDDLDAEKGEPSGDEEEEN